MWLLVGLGNPGPKYAFNRHNIGFMAVDAIAERRGFGQWRSTKVNALAAEGSLGGEKVLAVKPLTYMNDSGNAVGALARFYKVPPRQVVVVHDELDLPPGKFRIKTGGGNGGHNGLRSIDAHIGPDYRRIRLGIGHPGDKAQVLHYVLGDFSGSDKTWLVPLLDALADAADLIVSADEQAYANRVTVLTQPPKPKPEPRAPG